MKTTAEAVVDDAESYAPGPWELREAVTNGNFKARATYVLPRDDGSGQVEAVLEVRPYKSYDQPGFCDCHRLRVRDYRARDPPATEVLGDSPSETEYVDETLDLANVVMTDLLEAEPGPDPGAVDVEELEPGDEVRVNWWDEPLVVVGVSTALAEEPVATARGWGVDEEATVDLTIGDDGRPRFSVDGGPERIVESLRRAD